MSPARCLLVTLTTLAGCTSDSPEPKVSVVGTWTFQQRMVTNWASGVATTRPDSQLPGSFITTYHPDGRFTTVVSPTTGPWTFGGTYVHSGNTLTTQINSTGSPTNARTVSRLLELSAHRLVTEEEVVAGGYRDVMTATFTR